MEPVDHSCRKECEELQFCLEEAEELKGNREMEVDVEEPDVLSSPLEKAAVLQVGDGAIAATRSCCFIGSKVSTTFSQVP